MISNTA
jgi:hypothetical protein